RTREPGAGFPALLERVWQRARTAPDLRASLDILLGLDGHVPPQVQLRALSTTEEAALHALWGLTWREDTTTDTATVTATATGESESVSAGAVPALDLNEAAAEEPVFVGELALATTGRIVLRGPAQGPLDRRHLVGGV
ncbi:hypothetical protein G3I23_40635, partial [Streptomyces sp. SID10115]|nr:hypothetical protein [Streptomyces sp. SID10115]